METLLSSDFWSDQIAAALKGWAILIPLILALWAAFKIKLAKIKKEMRRLKAYTEAVESRLQLARELNAGEAQAIAEIRTEVDGLRQLIKAKARRSRVEPIIEEVDASAATLAMTNRTTDHVLTAEGLAIGGLEEKQKLRLIPRPSSPCGYNNRIMSSESKASSSSGCLPTGDDHGPQKSAAS